MQEAVQNISFAQGNTASFGMVLLCILVSFLCGSGVSLIYNKTHTGFSFNRSFSFTLLMVCIIISLIMVVIQSNLALSLGLVGSLSIIRFRTVLKETRDMTFLFWVICIGLAAGSGNFMVAFMATFVVGGIILLYEKFLTSKSTHQDFIMLVRMSPDVNMTEQGITAIMKECNIECHARSSMVDNEDNFKEITYSIKTRLKPDALENLIDRINQMSGVRSTSLLSPETNLYV